MTVLPPGTILQLLYLKERLSETAPGRFIEIGPGSGEITRLLLSAGWVGTSYDIEEKTIVGIQKRFAEEIAEKRFCAVNADYLATDIGSTSVDLVISCMVMEHLKEDQQKVFMAKSAGALKKRGLMIGLVPSSPAHWGIEDEIAGHYRRYTKEKLAALLDECNWDLLHIAGLTFPTSNLLLSISNYLVERSERSKLALSMSAKTKSSGQRRVRFKTYFPALMGMLLNTRTLLPLHFIQKMFLNSNRAMVLYFEAKHCAEAIKT